jgi:putative FmdB family regulatory protein
VPLYEFECRRCGHRFEELVGPHVGLTEGDVACPECKAADPERLISGSYATISNRLTSGQKRRLEDKRGTGRGGAMERFRKQRAAEKRAGKGPGG